ncbi:MAG: insulinase family protein [Meiothermus sp.]|uniref:M16 family metallopeptidase n=1 Tax=Meiothermus sp. TaxID=1955249 RepID=UPI0025FD93E6|nr:pitrilysin family protein [Meiothermus sp.]MCS7057843.1 insulinase family protein [Meiothermus sp.]MCS7194590.1 insulinase family protein [Meiothermus sp.]MDW8090785.1 pitrilysin family protein [Meiothermus sp.]MDW8480792.1 pitrilysin family protein [Meiothermus sp.]
MALTKVEVLPNGLTLAVEERPWSPTVAMRLLLPVGVVTDPEGMEGAAGLLEGWLWKGAGGRDARALADAFDGLGVQRASASGLEHTAFAAQFLAEKLRPVLALYADVLMRPHLPEEALEPVRQAALQQWAAMEDQPSKKMFVALRRAVFRSPHGRNPDGERAGLERATARALREDFARRYAPRGAVLAMVGGVRFEEAKEAVEEALGDWRGEGVAHPPVELSPPHALHIEQNTAQVQIGLAYPDVTLTHPEFYTARLAVQVLSGGSSSRLFTEVREKRGLVYSVSATPNGVKGYSYLRVYAGTTPERADETLRVLQEEIARLSEGVTEGELQRTKVGLRAALVMQDESSRHRAASMARDLFMLGRVRPLDEIEARIAEVDLPRVNRYLAEHPYRNPWVATLGPRRLVLQ